MWKHSSSWLGRTLQHPLSRPSSIRGVEDLFRLDVDQTFNNVQMNGWSCSPKHGPAHFTVLKTLFIWMVWSFSKTFEFYGWAVLLQTRRSSVHSVEELFCLDVMQPIKHNQVDGWAALPYIPCHGIAHFAALKNRFVLMLCRYSTTFKWTDVRAPPNTVQGISRCWKTFLSGWYETFQKGSNLWLGCAPPNTAQFCLRCWRFYLSGCSAAM